MNFFKRLEENNKYGEPYISKIFTGILEKLSNEEMLSFLQMVLKSNDLIKSVRTFSVAEQKFEFFFTLKFPTKPDICIMVKNNESEVFYIVFEVKKDNYYFETSDNPEQLRKNLEVVVKHNNAIMIGISDRVFNLSEEVKGIKFSKEMIDKFVHHEWKQIFEHFNSQVFSSSTRLLISELKKYKNLDGVLMDSFSENFDDLLRKSVIMNQIKFEKAFEKYYEQIEEYLDNLNIMIKAQLTDNVRFKIFDSSNDVFTVRQVLKTELNLGINFQVQFRARFDENNPTEIKRYFVGFLIFPREAYNKTYDIIRQKAVQNDFLQNPSARYDNEYKYVFIRNDKINFNDPDWVRTSREEIVNKSVTLLNEVLPKLSIETVKEAAN